ncbi:MAG: arylsulfotransferase family protein [Bacteroidota bacterium]
MFVKRGGILVIIFTLLCLFAFSVRHVATGGTRLGFISKPLMAFSEFPATVYDVLTSKEIKGVCPTYVEKDSSFVELNILDYDVYGLNSFFNAAENRWDINLFNFRNDSVIYSWQLEKESFLRTGERHFQNSRLKNPLLLPDRSLIAVSVESNNLYRLDKKSNVLWHNTGKNFHHSLNLSLDGNIWACTSAERRFRLGSKGHLKAIKDDFISKIDLENGQIIYDKSVSDILMENGYKNFVYGFSNDGKPNMETDPIHLNDVQPVYKRGPFWEAGDLMLSLRHKSLVIHYRPENNKIIRMINGPFLNQHDVDVISDTEIAIFNNNSTNIGFDPLESDLAVETEEIADDLLYSDIIIYNYRDSSYRPYLPELFVKEKIYSQTEGSYEFLDSGDLCLESQNDAKIYFMNKDGILLKKQFDTPAENYVHLPNWIRIYENINF